MGGKNLHKLKKPYTLRSLSLIQKRAVPRKQDSSEKCKVPRNKTNFTHTIIMLNVDQMNTVYASQERSNSCEVKNFERNNIYSHILFTDLFETCQNSYG